jgi:hypothetical protein
MHIELLSLVIAMRTSLITPRLRRHDGAGGKVGMSNSPTDFGGCPDLSMPHFT